MSERLIDELKRRGGLRDDQIELLRRHRERLGGEIDLCLLELNLIHENELILALGPAYGLDVAGPEEWTRAPDALAVRSFPEQWARKHHLAPLRLDLNRLSLLTAAPPDLELFTRLSGMLELELVPVLAPAIRVHQRLALLYGITPSARVAALLERGGGVGRESLRPPVTDRPAEISSILTADPLTFAEAVSRLRSARDRDEIVQLTLSHARREFDFAALFAVHDDHISGWRAAGEGAENIKNIRIPTGARSAFWMALNTQAHFLGPLTDSDREIMKGLLRGTPRAALMIPLRVRGRSVAVLYVENGPRAIAPRVAAGLMVFSTHVQQSLESLLLRQKAEASGSKLIRTSDGPLPVPEPVHEEPPAPPPGPPPEVPSWVQAIEEVTEDITIEVMGPAQPVVVQPVPAPEPEPERSPEPPPPTEPKPPARPLHLELIRVAEEESRPPEPRAEAEPGSTDRDRLLLEAAARLEQEVSAALETTSDDIHPGDEPSVFAPEQVAELVVAAQVKKRLSSQVKALAPASPAELDALDTAEDLIPPRRPSEAPPAGLAQASRLAMQLDSAPADPGLFSRPSDPAGSEPDMPIPGLEELRELRSKIREEADLADRPPILGDEVQAPVGSDATLVDLETANTQRDLQRLMQAPLARPVDANEALEIPEPVTDPELDIEQVQAELIARREAKNPIERSSSRADAALSPEAWMRASSEITRPRGIRGSISPDADWRAPPPPPGAVSAVGPVPRPPSGTRPFTPPYGAGTSPYGVPFAQGTPPFVAPSPRPPSTASAQAPVPAREPAPVALTASPVAAPVASPVNESQQPLAMPVVPPVEAPALPATRPLVPSRDPSQAVGSYPPAASSKVRSIPATPDKSAASEARSYSLLDLETLLDQLEGPSPDLRRAAREELERVGPSVLPLVGERFPGRVYVDPFARQGRLPPFSECGELLALLTAFGAEAHPFVVGHLDASLPALRFFALYFYQAVHVPEAIPRLVRRIHDEETRIAMQAVHTLFPYQNEPEFDYVFKHLHERFRSAPMKAKEQTVRLLTLFRDGSAVPALIEVFERKDKKLYDLVEGALAEITKQRFGISHKRWAAWWRENKDLPRTRWLLAGLDADDVDLRESSIAELRLLAGTDFGYDSHASRRKREAARRRAEQWVQGEGAQGPALRA